MHTKLMKLLLGFWLFALSTAPASAAPTISPAAAIAAQLSSNVVSLTDYTATTDPEQLLGIPGQYTSKAGFTDLYHVVGVVEVFDTPGDLANRLFQLRAVQVYAAEEMDIPLEADSTSRVLLRLWIPPTAFPGTFDSYAIAFRTALLSAGFVKAEPDSYTP